jgi:hypothetical protein
MIKCSLILDSQRPCHRWKFSAFLKKHQYAGPILFRSMTLAVALPARAGVEAKEAIAADKKGSTIADRR